MKFALHNVGLSWSKVTKSIICFSLCVLGLVAFNTSRAQTPLSVTFNYTGAVQYYTVPACVTSIEVTCAGAQGGGNTGNSQGGRGCIMTGTIAVTPGQVLEIYVGGQGTLINGGWNGGGNGWSGAPTSQLGSYGGGGASDIRIAPYGLANRVVVGGGGGGSASQSGQYTIPGGNGGCINGFAGAGSPFTGTGGGGGTQFAPGAAGPPWGGGLFGNPGVGPNGGNGAHDLTFGTSGGGGGGGYYGGGGGGGDNCCVGANGGGAGGGGSSYALNQVACVQGTATGNTGNGYVTIVTSNAVTASNTGPYCEGSTIQLNASPGATYAWTGPNGFTSALQNPTIPNAALTDTGVYSVTVSGVGCLAAATTTVVVVPQIFPNAGPDDTVCFGGPFLLNGTITVPTDVKTWSYFAPTVIPAPGIAFTPNSSSLTPTISVTSPGTYNFILTETNPVCGIAKDTVTIFVKQMDIQTMATDPTCAGLADGTITVAGTDATEASFDNGATWSTNLSGSGFTAGVYDVCVRDVNLCQACVQVTLVDPPAIVLSTSNDTLICENGTATLIASATNGAGFTYNWTQFPTNGDTQYGSPAADTYYLVQAMSSNGCLSNFDSIHVTVRPPISGVISPDASICPGYNTMLSATAQDGIGAPYTFTWSDGTVGNGASHSYMVSPPTTQNFTVSITDACESSALVLTNLITVSPVPEPMFIADTTEKCEPAEFDLYVTTDTADYVSASWLISDGQFFVNTDTIMTAEMMEGHYSVQLVLTNQFGCIDSVTYGNYLVSHPLPVAKFKFYPGVPTMFATDVQFTNFSINEYASSWTFESGSPASSIEFEPSTTFPEGEIGFYDVELVVTSDFGCRDTAVQTVEVKPEVLLYAPNTFTPDGDEFNGSWRIHIVGIDVQDFELQVRNRWGELIWESHDIDASWDGTYNNMPVPQGTYSWFIRAKDLVTDAPYLFKGHVMILK